jgi:hypothetical protein
MQLLIGSSPALIYVYFYHSVYTLFMVGFYCRTILQSNKLFQNQVNEVEKLNFNPMCNQT